MESLDARVQMQPKNTAQQILEGAGEGGGRISSQRSNHRSSFSPIRSPIKALKTLSISSIASVRSHASSSDTDVATPVSERRRSTLRKLQPPDASEDLARQPSNSFSDAYTELESLSTRPGTTSQGTSIPEESTNVVKSGSLQVRTSLLKSRKDHLVLTPVALMKFKSKLAAIEMFPQISTPTSAIEAHSPAHSLASFKDFGAGADMIIPLETIVAVFKDEGIKPSFGIEVWWMEPKVESAFTMLELNFALPDDRDDWLKQLQYVIKQRTRSISEERTPPQVEVDFAQIIGARHPQLENTTLDIFPVIPRRPYSRPSVNSRESKKGWRDGSSFYLASSKNICMLAQFSSSPSGQRVNPNFVQFGLVTLSKVSGSLHDERFDLMFRLPLDKPKKLSLASRHHRSIVSRLFEADTYLKPAWPLWTRREIFFIDGESQKIRLTPGEDYGGFRRTLEAFLEGYHCLPVNWTVIWKGVKYPPEFRLLPPSKKSRYTAHQLLAVFRALRFNDFFKSLSFRSIDFSVLTGVSDNSHRLEPTAWLSRTGKRSLSRDEFEVVENSPVIFHLGLRRATLIQQPNIREAGSLTDDELNREITALMLSSEALRHLDLADVLKNAPAPRIANTPGKAPTNRICELVPPVVLLLSSLQTRCRSIVLSGNPMSAIDARELSRTLQNLPGTMKRLDFSRCQLDSAALASLWTGIHEQRSNLEVLDLAHNTGQIAATKVSETLRETHKMRQLSLAHVVKGSLDGPLFRPWNSSPYLDPWRLEEVNLSGWKINIDTISALLRYMEIEYSSSLCRLILDNCGISGEIATAILCRLGPGRNMHLSLSENPLEENSTEWIDLIHGNWAPRMLQLDMVQFRKEFSFNRLLTALTQNTTIEFLSLVGTGPPSSASTSTSELLSRFFQTNSTLQFLDFSGYSGKLEDGHMGWGLSEALGALGQNTSLRQVRIRNQNLGASEDVTDLCRVIAGNPNISMLDIQHNNFNHHQFVQIVNAIGLNHRLMSFPLSDADQT